MVHADGTPVSKRETPTMSQLFSSSSLGRNSLNFPARNKTATTNSSSTNSLLVADRDQGNLNMALFYCKQKIATLIHCGVSLDFLTVRLAGNLRGQRPRGRAFR